MGFDTVDWIAYSLVMFFGSVALYLAVRKSTLMRVPRHLTNLAMFAIPLIAYLGLGIVGGHSYALSAVNAVSIILVSILFAYIGNKMSLHAIDIAPNPGYSLVLSKSYVLFTALVSVLLFGAELTLRSAIAILIIVIFSVLIMIDPKNAKKTSSKKWIHLSIGAFFAWGFLSLSSKYLFSNGVDTIAFLTYLYAIVTACIVGVDGVDGNSFSKLRPKEWLVLFVVGVFSTVFNFGNFQSISTAPNVGYVNAINAGSISAVTVFAVLVFKDELTFQKAIGVSGVTLGVLLLVL